MVRRLELDLYCLNIVLVFLTQKYYGLHFGQSSVAKNIK